jgi:hypothetical protein
MLPGHYGSYSFPCSTPPAHVAQHLAERSHHECRRGGDRRYWHCAHPCPHLYTGTGLTAATSAPGLGSPLPPLRWDWAHPCHLCAGTGLAPATSALGLGSPLPPLRRDWAHPCHLCARTGLTPATSALGLGSPLPPLRRDWAHPCHLCARTGLTPATSHPPCFAHCNRDGRGREAHTRAGALCVRVRHARGAFCIATVHRERCCMRHARRPPPQRAAQRWLASDGCAATRARQTAALPHALLTASKAFAWMQRATRNIQQGATRNIQQHERAWQG